MTQLSSNLAAIKNDDSIKKVDFVKEVIGYINDAGYTIVEINDQKPWGAYIRMSSDEAKRFIQEFFPGLTPEEARLGIDDAELSPKFLIVAPNQRLSWQYHNRRAERWAFLTPGGYKKSETDEEGDTKQARPGDVVQFLRGERHRLVGVGGQYVVVAEIWQHAEIDAPSDEDDIVRLADDYKR